MWAQIYRKKQQIYETYHQELKDTKQIKILKPKSESNLIPFRVALSSKGPQEHLSEFLSTKGIEARTFFYPLHKQPCFSFLADQQDFRDENFRNSVYAYEHGLCLPAYPSLTVQEIKYICDRIKEYCDEL